MRFRHLAEQIYQRPWFITPGAHASIRMLFERALAQGGTKAELDMADFFQQRRPLVVDANGIASIHILGPLGKNLSRMEKSCGATSFEEIHADHAAAIAGGARGILLDIDSPGGTVLGTPEVADLIATRPVPTIAYTEDTMASAAYYLAASADFIVASRSAIVGSIGVYIPWIDSSAMYAAEGLRPDPIVNTGGDLKTTGFGGTLSPAQRAFLQEGVDADFGDFKAHVRAYRGVPDNAMRGQWVSGQGALDYNLVDVLGNREVARAKLLELMGAPAGALGG